MRLNIGAPNEKQREFFLARTKYVGYGGARGGGKSWAVRTKALLLALRYPGIKILLVRRSFAELRENHVLPLISQAGEAARYYDGEKCFIFKNGSRIKLGYCDGEEDVRQYQGREYDVIFIDEATQLTERQFMHLKLCCRGANRFPKRVYITCNPGGVGHAWVKRLFIDRRYKNGERREDYTFIPARARDNTALLKHDPEYLRMLDELPGALRRAWRDGSWDVFAGQYFPEFDRGVHTVEPFPLPAHYRRYVSVDYGLDMCAILWIAVGERGECFVYREFYRPDVLISDAAKKLLELSEGEDIHAFLAPPDLWSRQRESGRTIAEIFMENGISLTRTGNGRVEGWFALKEELKLPQNGGPPALRIFKTCENLIRCIPMLIHDEKNPNDCSIHPHEITHAPDALRGFCIYRRQSARAPSKRGFDFFKSGAKKKTGSGYGDDLRVI